MNTKKNSGKKDVAAIAKPKPKTNATTSKTATKTKKDSFKRLKINEKDALRIDACRKFFYMTKADAYQKIWTDWFQRYRLGKTAPHRSINVPGKFVPVVLRVSQDIYTELKNVAKNEGKTTTYVIASIIEEWMSWNQHKEHLFEGDDYGQENSNLGGET